MNNKKKSTKLTIKDFLLSTAFLFNSCWLIGSLIVILGLVLSDHPYGQFPSDLQTSIVCLVGSLWIIFACIVVIIRKEIPRIGLSSIKGSWAVFQGIIGLLVFGSLEVIFLFSLFQEISSK